MLKKTEDEGLGRGSDILSPMTGETTLKSQRHTWIILIFFLAKIVTAITLDAHKIQILLLKSAFKST
jgi:hypothetical protein